MKKEVYEYIWVRNHGKCEKCSVSLFKENEVEKLINTTKYKTKGVSVDILKYKINCWKCSKELWMITYYFESFYTYCLGSINKLDKILLYLDNVPDVKIEERYSKTLQEIGAYNVCPHCDNIQANFYIGDQLDNGSFEIKKLKSIIMDFEYEDLLDMKDCDGEKKAEEEEKTKIEKSYYLNRVKRAGHIHHIDKNRGNNTDENLKLLCVDCHIKEHNNDKKASNLLKASNIKKI